MAEKTQVTLSYSYFLQCYQPVSNQGNDTFIMPYLFKYYEYGEDPASPKR